MITYLHKDLISFVSYQFFGEKSSFEILLIILSYISVIYSLVDFMFTWEEIDACWDFIRCPEKIL